MKTLGGRRVKFTGARRADDGGLETVIAIVQELAPAAEELDVRVLVEQPRQDEHRPIDDYARIARGDPDRARRHVRRHGALRRRQRHSFAVIERFAPTSAACIALKDTAARGAAQGRQLRQRRHRRPRHRREMLGHGYRGICRWIAPPRRRRIAPEREALTRHLYPGPLEHFYDLPTGPPSALRHRAVLTARGRSAGCRRL